MHSHADGLVDQRRRAFIIAAGAFMWGRGSALAKASKAVDNWRFLAIYEHDSSLTANIEIAEGLASGFAKLQGGREIYAEHRDSARFSGGPEDRRFVEELTRKYRQIALDAVLAIGPGALRLVLEHRAEFAPSAPVIFGAVSLETVRGMELPLDVYGIASSFDVRRTVALARALQPDARRLTVFTGSSAFDRSWAARARQELGGLEGIAVDYVTDLSLEGFQDAAAALPPDAILLILTIFEDAEGAHFIPRDAAAMIGQRTAAPAYSVYSTFIGGGVVGGYVETFEAIGQTIADLAVVVTTDEMEVPQISSVVGMPVVDWRAMRRFGLETERLPSEAVLLHYDPTAWERYRLQILLAGGVFLLQSGTIGALVVQDRRRRAAEREAAARRLELAHLSRVAQLGELSGALAHELNQPLTSILANAEVAAELIKDEQPDLRELAEIVTDIAADDRRASRIITELRRLMSRGEVAFETIDLNEVVRSILGLTRSEMIVRQVQVEVRGPSGDLPVRGSLAQLQQVLLNLMVNAADAMADVDPARRRIIIEIRIREDGVRELAVRDNGKGLAPEMREAAFKPFITAKPQGLGLGLSIARTIAHAHGGALAFDDTAVESARVVLTLPAP
jgi:signal transduction histidine kinase